MQLGGSFLQEEECRPPTSQYGGFFVLPSSTTPYSQLGGSGLREPWQLAVGLRAVSGYCVQNSAEVCVTCNLFGLLAFDLRPRASG